MKQLLTNDDDCAVFAADSDVSTSFIAQAGDVGSLRADDSGEGRSVRQGKESNVGKAGSAVNGFLDKGLCLVQTSLVTSFDGPDRFALFGFLVIFGDLPLGFVGVGLIVDASRGGRTIRSRCLLGLGRVLDLHTKSLECPEELALVGDGMVILQGYVDGG